MPCCGAQGSSRIRRRDWQRHGGCLKLLNFRARGRNSYGLIGPRGIIDLGARLRAEPTDLLSALRAGLIGSARALLDAPVADYTLADVQVLSPAGPYTRYFCIGVNYPDRNEEYKDGAERPKYPSLFMRTYTSFSAHEQPIVKPRESEQLDYEGEIVVVIGKGGRRIAPSDASSHVFGYSCANEGSVRD